MSTTVVGRPAVRAVLVLVAALTVGGWLAPAGPGGPVTGVDAAAADTRTYGGGAVDAIVAAAAPYERLDCGLDRYALAAMMMAPSFSESGAPVNQAPSPMTLSRWDTQPALWAFGDPGTAYQQAFWHPGIGLWQFDSAGFWDLTAADAIDVAIAAPVAAQVMSSRFCASSSTDRVAKMRYAWAPWYGCSSGSAPCLEVYNLLYDASGPRLRNVVRDETVTARGGMEMRTCRIQKIGTVPCGFVDPARAQGYAGFAHPTGAPTPISAPFYVFRANDREYRYWLPKDSGYAKTVAASKPVRSDARKSLTWSIVEQTGETLCDETTGTGVCAPFGRVDLAGGVPGGIDVRGWAIDPDTSDPVDVHVYVDGVGRAVTADRQRTDVGELYPQYGAAHGFETSFEGVTPGFHTVCVYVIDNHGVVVGNVKLGCWLAAVSSGSPVGVLEAAKVGPGTVEIIGWTFDPDTLENVTVDLQVDGVVATSMATVNWRKDIAAVFPGYAGNRGFQMTATGVAPGPHTVCAVARDAKAPGQAKTLGCKQVTLPSGSPIGALDAAVAGDLSVTVSGWALDPDVVDPLDVHVYIDGVGRANAVADLERADIGRFFAPWGPNHGYSVPIGKVRPGTHEACVFAINRGVGTNVKLGCRSFEVSSTPFGEVESLDAGPVSALLRGWAIDPDTSEPVNVHVYVDGRGYANISADDPREDLAERYPLVGGDHGFDLLITGLASGPHEVCTYAINRAGAGANVLLGCRSVTVAGGSPFGFFEAAPRTGDQVRAIGWAIDPDTPGPVDIHLYVDGVGASNRPADGVRNDVAAVFPTFGPKHGFDHTITVAPGPHTVCAFAYNVGEGSTASLGCRSV